MNHHRDLRDTAESLRIVPDRADSSKRPREPKGIAFRGLVSRFAESHHLSARECLVVQWTARGYSTKDTSDAMGCQIATINAYWLRIRRKTGLGSRLEVVARLLEIAIFDAYPGL
jgi:DNA-binding CsgD family transcriptional regulator